MEARFDNYERNHQKQLPTGFTPVEDGLATRIHIFVHANVESKTPLTQQSTVWLRWDKFIGDEVRHISGKTVICGHTSQSSGMPAMCDGFICIDTRAHGGLWLTCLDVDKELIWQASQSGEFRGPLRLKEIAAPCSLPAG